MESMRESADSNDVDVPVFPPGPKSQAQLKRLECAIGKTNYTGLYGIVLDVHRGDGPYMFDLDDNKYLDCLAAASVNILGYGNTKIPDKLRKVASAMQNTGFIYSPNVPAIDLAEHLIRITPGTHPKRVLLGLSGSDSNGGALEAVRKYTKKQGIIHFVNAYHGSTGLSQPASGFALLNKGIYPPSPKFVSVDFPATPEQATKTLKAIEEYLVTEPEKYGGVIAEVFQGDAGVFLPAKGFFPDLMKLLKKHKALLIVDEVQSGMGRTGKWWACDHEGIVPDLLVTGKGLAGGFMPVSAVIGRKEVLDSLTPGQQLFTFTGHPGCALAATSVIEHVEKHNLIDRAAKVGGLLKTELETLQKEYPNIIVDVRGKGLMLGMEINISADSWAAIIFATRSVEKGVYVGYFGANKEVVRIEPPLIIGETEVATIVRVLGEVAEEVHTGKIPEKTRENAYKYSVGL